MERIAGPDVSADLFGAGCDGFQDPEPGTTPATTVTADWLNAVQEAICRAIEGSGATLDGADHTQLLTAIVALASAKPDVVTSPDPIATTKFAWTPTDWETASVVRMTLTGNQIVAGLGESSIPKLIINVDSADTVTFAHDSLSATGTANRILTHNAQDLTLAPGESALFWPDATTGKWRVVSLSIDPGARNHTWTGTNVFTTLTGFNSGLYGNTNLSCINGDVQAFNDFLYCNGARVPTPKSRVVMVPLSYGQDLGSGQKYTLGSDGSITSAGSGVGRQIPLTHFLRTGSVITRVRVGWDNNGVAGVAPTFTLVRESVNTATGARTAHNEATPASGSGGTASSTTNSFQVMDSGTFTSTTVAMSVDAGTFAGSADEWFVNILSSDNASGDVCSFLEITLSDPGPRNH